VTRAPAASAGTWRRAPRAALNLTLTITVRLSCVTTCGRHVEKGTARWRERRARRLRELAPAWAARGAGAAAERLVTQAVAGNAWRGSPQRCAARAFPGFLSLSRTANAASRRCALCWGLGTVVPCHAGRADGAGLRRVQYSTRTTWLCLNTVRLMRGRVHTRRRVLAPCRSALDAAHCCMACAGAPHI